MKKVVFIMTMGHSGSSLLAVILGSHPKCFSVGELKVFSRHYQNRDKLHLDCVSCDSEFWEKTFGEEGLKKLSLGLGEKRINKYIPLKIDKEIRSWFKKDLIFNPYSLMFNKLNKDIIIDSSKYPLWIEKRMNAKEFTQGRIEAYLVYLIRDGRAVINSLFRKYPDNDIEVVSQDWVKKLKERNVFFKQFPSERKIKISYEELASNPQETTEKICQLLGVEFTPNMLNYWEYEHHDLSGNDGTYSLIRRYQGKELIKKTQLLHGKYYQEHDLGIKLDLRWQRELDPEKLAVFNRIAGEYNKPYESN